jgi:hypothetical protein
MMFYARLEAQSALEQRYNCAAFSTLRERPSARRSRQSNLVLIFNL